jgi:hypothetical protein
MGLDGHCDAWVGMESAIERGCERRRRTVEVASALSVSASADTKCNDTAKHASARSAADLSLDCIRKQQIFITDNRTQRPW